MLGIGAGGDVPALGAAAARHPAHRAIRARCWASAYGVLLGISGLFAIVGDVQPDQRRGDVHGRAASRASSSRRSRSRRSRCGRSCRACILTYHGISASMGEGSRRVPAADRADRVRAVRGRAGDRADEHARRTSPIAAPMPLLHVVAAALPGLTFAAMAGRGSVLRGVPVRWVTWRQFTLAIAISMAVATMDRHLRGVARRALAASCCLLVHHGAFAHAQNWSGITDRIERRRLHPVEQRAVLRGADHGVGVRAAVGGVREGAERALPAAADDDARAGVHARRRGRGRLRLPGGDALRAERHLGQPGRTGGRSCCCAAAARRCTCFCTGLAGLAWWYWTVAKRSRLAAGLFGLAVLFHAAWNAAFTLLESRIFGLDTLSDRTLEVIAYVIVAAASSAFIVAIPIVARRLRERGAAERRGDAAGGDRAVVGVRKERGRHCYRPRCYRRPRLLRHRLERAPLFAITWRAAVEFTIA